MKTVASCILLLFACSPSFAQGPPRPGVTKDWGKVAQRIAWHGTWKGTLAAAKTTRRPILLIAAAPHCGQVPGMW